MESMELMQRVHAGDGEAFKTLYGRYSQVVYRVAFQELQDQDQSLSVVKAVFRTVYDTLRERGPIEGDFYGWLDAQTARELRLRNQAARQTEIPPATPPVFPERPAPEPKAPRKISATPVPPPPPKVHHYSEREAEAIEARALSRLNHVPPEEIPPEIRKRPAGVFAILGGVAVCGVLIWLLAGLLMRLGVLPFIDLGYVWFDTAFFPLFQ